MGGYISFSDPFQISNPSQLLCNSSTLLKSFSKGKPSQNHLTTYRVDLLNQNTFSDPSQMEYMFYFSNPSQILIQRNLLSSFLIVRMYSYIHRWVSVGICKYINQGHELFLAGPILAAPEVHSSTMQGTCIPTIKSDIIYGCSHIYLMGSCALSMLYGHK